jgi:hypothetical protein
MVPTLSCSSLRPVTKINRYATSGCSPGGRYGRLINSAQAKTEKEHHG